MPKLVGITGGIGSGKSIVSNVLLANGYTVYDCDTRAKLIMDNSVAVKQKLCCIAGKECVDSRGEINRKHLADKLFSVEEIRRQVNALVHGLVRDDIASVATTLTDKDMLFVESAIMRSSGLDTMMDEIWIVDAPTELRVLRVMKRNGFDPQHILDRIQSQADEYTNLNCKTICHINNDNNHSILLQIDNLLKTKH